MSRKICVVGLGLMGGSMAMALKDFEGMEIWGIDNDEATCQSALDCGAVSRAFAPGDAAQALAHSALTILCLYPEAALAFLAEQGRHIPAGGVVTDLVGVKAPLLRAAAEHLPQGVHFVGGHPMAGREKSGFTAATGTLFKNCNYILTPTQDTHPAALALITRMARYAGAGRVTLAEPRHHDHMIAYTSQMAHVLAAAIVRHPALMDSPGFDGGSFADLTRVATLNEEMWSQLFLLNKQPLCQVLSDLEKELRTLRHLIEADDKEPLIQALASSTRRKGQWEEAGEAGGRVGLCPTPRQRG